MLGQVAWGLNARRAFHVLWEAQKDPIFSKEPKVAQAWTERQAHGFPKDFFQGKVIKNHKTLI